MRFSATSRRRLYVGAHVVLGVVAPLLYAIGAVADHLANLVPLREQP